MKILFAKKVLKLNRGFTIVEVLAAFGLLMVVVFTFSPFLLKNLDDIYFAGQRRAELFESKAEVETVLALHGADLAQEELKVAFKDVDDNPYSPVYTIGVNIQAGDITTFYSNTDPSMTLNPIIIDEGETGTTINIVGSFLNFTDASLFKLRENITGNVVSSGVSFALNADNPSLATLTLSTGLNMAGSPYGVYYGDTFTPLRVNPPKRVAVGAGGAYLSSNGDGTWVRQNFPTNNNITTDRLNDVAWSGNQYLIPANAGKLYFSQGGWESASQATSTGTWNGLYYYSVSSPNITAVHYSHVLDEYFTGATFTGDRRYWVFWTRTDTYGYISSGSTVEELDEDPDSSDYFANFTAIDTISSGLSRGDSNQILLTGGKYGDDGSVGFIYHQNRTTGQNIVITKDSGNYDLQRIKQIYWVDTPGAEIFKAVGSGGRIYSSINGTSWVRDTLPGTTKPSSFNSICFGAGKWVAVGNSNWALVYDTAAQTPAWVSVQIRSTSATFNRVSYVGGKFYVCGNGGLIFSSINGSTWTAEPTNSTLDLFGIQGR